MEFPIDNGICGKANSKNPVVISFHLGIEKFGISISTFANKEVGEIDGVQINVISKNDLLLDKEKLSRDKDLADLENLKKSSYKGFTR